MPHFLKHRATISTGRLRQESRTHEHRVGSDAALMFPVGVKLFWPSIIQLFHCSRRRSLNGLFRETSSGWRILVKPPGITAMSVFVWCTARFTESTRWAWKESQTRRLFFLNRPPGRDRHTSSTHSFFPVSSIHPFGWQCTRTPGGSSLLARSFVWRSPWASAWFRQPCMQVRQWTASCVEQHSFRTFLIHGSGWWHVKPDRRFVHVPNVNKFVISFLRLLIAKRWKLVIFWSRCSGSFWAIFVFCRRARFFRRRNLVHQQLEARNPVVCNSEAVAISPVAHQLFVDTEFTACGAIVWLLCKLDDLQLKLSGIFHTFWRHFLKLGNRWETTWSRPC